MYIVVQYKCKEKYFLKVSCLLHEMWRQDGKLYLIAHYPVNLETAMESIKEYAAKLGKFIFGTFVDRSDKAMLLPL